jgi:hypothetical protein
VTFADLIRQVIALLDASAVPYMITGSLASSYHGEPRATRVLDVVIDPMPSGLDSLIDGLRAANFYVDRDAAATPYRNERSSTRLGQTQRRSISSFAVTARSRSRNSGGASR